MFRRRRLLSSLFPVGPVEPGFREEPSATMRTLLPESARLTLAVGSHPTPRRASLCSGLYVLATSGWSPR